MKRTLIILLIIVAVVAAVIVWRVYNTGPRYDPTRPTPIGTGTPTPSLGQ